MESQINKSKEVLRVGKVVSVNGRTIEVLVDKTKNNSHLLFEGQLVRNVSVGSYVKITKGFEQLIGKIESEFVVEDKAYSQSSYKKESDKVKRILSISLVGYFEANSFEQGIKELPLIDNECFILTKVEYDRVHAFVKDDEDKINIGVLSSEASKEIELSINTLFASHIGIFGNTGSGKSYSLASLYHSLFKKYQNKSEFKKNAKFLLIDFNGEYSGISSIIEAKKVYQLDTGKKTTSYKKSERLPINEDVIINYEILSILSNATDKTQRPFIKRAVKLYKQISVAEDALNYFRNSFKRILCDVLKMADKQKAYQLIDHIEKVVNFNKEIENFIKLKDDVEFQNKFEYFKNTTSTTPITESEIENVNLYRELDNYNFPENFVDKLLHFFSLRLIYDMLEDRAQFEHIGPAINKLESSANDLQKVIDFNSTEKSVFSDEHNFCIVDLNKCNLDIKKVIPLILSKHVYEFQKKLNDKSKYLNIIIDEAHNILSYTSNRESETWKDYRLETFEEMIKEGRKFGTFLTLASQRPSDISSTIISQLHNYFLHRLINNKDIEAIEKTVSYLDKVSFESLPILPTGTCIVAGLSAKLPVVVKMNPLKKEFQPNSQTIKLTDYWGNIEADSSNVQNLTLPSSEMQESDELPF